MTRTVSTSMVLALLVAIGSAPALAKNETLGSPWYTNPVGWSLVGAGAASLIAGGVVWSEYQSNKDLAVCNDGVASCGSFEERAKLADKAGTQETASMVLFAVGGILITGGVLAFVLMSEPEASADGGDDTSALRLRGVAPVVGAATAGMGATFSF